MEPTPLKPSGKVADPGLWRDCERLVPNQWGPLPVRLGRIDDAEVWLVEANRVRRDLYMDFNYGGHDLVYGPGNKAHPHLTFIPKGQVWIDGNLSRESVLTTLYHEIVERRRMSHGQTYGNAHNAANKGEKMLFRSTDDHIKPRYPRKNVTEATVSASLSPFMQPIGMLRREPLRLVSGVVGDGEPIVRHEDPSRTPLKLLKKRGTRAR